MYQHTDSDGTSYGIIGTMFPWICPDTARYCNDRCVCCTATITGGTIDYTCIKYGVHLATITAPESTPQTPAQEAV